MSEKGVHSSRKRNISTTFVGSRRGYGVLLKHATSPYDKWDNDQQYSDAGHTADNNPGQHVAVWAVHDTVVTRETVAAAADTDTRRRQQQSDICDNVRIIDRRSRCRAGIVRQKIASCSGGDGAYVSESWTLGYGGCRFVVPRLTLRQWLHLSATQALTYSTNCTYILSIWLIFYLFNIKLHTK